MVRGGAERSAADAGPSISLVGRVRTLDPRAPIRARLYVVDGYVSDVPAAGAPRVRLPHGAVIVPGFVDPHLHLLATAARRLSVDLTAAATLGELRARLASHISRLAPGAWVRAQGHDGALLAERRGPNRDDLDSVSPGNPLVLHDRTGHEVVCNTLALRHLGLDRLPARAGVEVVNGRTTGRVHDAEHLLRGVPAQEPAKLRAAVAETSAVLAAAGVTAITDAGHENGIGALEMLDALVRDGTIAQRVEAMVGFSHLDEIASTGASFGHRYGAVSLGHVKIVPERAGAAPVLDEVRRVHARGWPVAIHVLDIGPLDEALEALGRSPAPADTRDRLEHVALSLSEQVWSIARSGAGVVSQPAFLVERADKYRQALTKTEQAWLYRVGSLVRAGVIVAASSDAPVSAATPLVSLAAAVDRSLGDTAERVDPTRALELVTRAAGAVGSSSRGMLDVGAPADFAVLDHDPTSGDAHVLATFIAGRPVFGGL